MVISVLLYARETWTLTEDILTKLLAIERYDALGNCLASHTETTSLMIQSKTESGNALGPLMTS